MKFAEYMDQTDLTVVYPETVETDYLVHGIVDEAGELFEKTECSHSEGLSFMDRAQGLPKLPFHMRTTEDNLSDFDELVKELGDVLWYVARFVKSEGLFREDGEFNMPDPNEAVPSVMGVHVFQHVALGLLVTASKINGYRKKTHRDGEDYTEQFEEAIFEILQSATLLAHCMGFRLSYVMEKNIDKLLDRGERGVIQGNGDNR